MEPTLPTEPTTENELWNAEVVSATRVIIRSYPLRTDSTIVKELYVLKAEKFSGRTWAGNSYIWLRIFEANRPELIGKWVAVCALDGSSKLIKLTAVPAAPPVSPSKGKIVRVRKWGDEI